MLIVPASSVFSILFSKPKYWDVISVCRNDSLPPKSLCRRHVHVNCDDILDDAMGLLAIDSSQKGHTLIPPNEGHIIQAIRFSRETELDRLLIHCVQGRSRSPAIAWCILYDRLNDENAAWDELNRIRKRIIPSNRIIRIGKEIIPKLPAVFPTE